MKIITKPARLVLALALLLANTITKAQTESRSTFISFGLNGGVPTQSSFNYTVGADFRFQRDLSRKVAAIASIGYTEFQQGKGRTFADFGFVPIKVGAKVYPLSRLYLSGELGAAVMQYKAQESEFIWAPGVGYSFDNGFDLGARYEESRRRGVATGQVAFRAAYNFNLSEIMRRF